MLFRSGENDSTKDINFSLELKEYRKIKTKKKKKKEKVTKKMAAPIMQRTSKELEGTIYTIKKGDDLFKVSKTMTGSTANWLALYKQNKDIIGDNPKALFPGQRLVVRL